MRIYAFLASAIAAAVLLQALLADRAIWHEGWYSVLLAGTLALLLRSAFAKSLRRGKPALVAVTFGTTVLAFAGIASGLLAPDPQEVVGAPGSAVPEPDLGGSLLFAPLRSATPPQLLRAGRAPVRIASQRYVGAFVLRDVMRTVVAVDAYDRSGARLTITQPTGTAFSSPVLLMQESQRIAGLGLELPFDEFAVPAAHRIVKVALFSAQQVALLRGIAGPSRAAVLFLVDDETDQPLPHGIRLAQSGETVAVAGLRLRAEVLRYPAVDVLSAPSLPVLVFGFCIIAIGAALMLFRTLLRS